jgi:two-component system response regulator AtoC
MIQDRYIFARPAVTIPPMRLIVGETAVMRAIVEKLERFAVTDVPVLLQGESGTGKEVLARLIHLSSHRSKNPLVKLSCPAIPPALLETELFGHERGAFTGAHVTKQGRVEQAHNGTLFLDEVGSLDIASQSKLLQVLDDGTFVRVGGQELRTIATRLISTSNGDLQRQVENGTFRLDFLFRINAVTIHVPPLRERRADIPMLAGHFIEQNARTFGMTPKRLSDSTLQRMQAHSWPGNIRQLENLLRSYVLTGREETILEQLESGGKDTSEILTEVDLNGPIYLKRITKKATQELERKIIFKVLQANRWNRQKTAKCLKISYRSLLYKLNDFNMPELSMKQGAEDEDGRMEGRPVSNIIVLHKTGQTAE